MKRRKDIPEGLWKSIVANIPMACVDVIIHGRVQRETQVLLGFRKIYPYGNCWALPGGRIIRNESLREAGNRQLEEINIRPTGEFKLVGVYPVNFKHTSGITVSPSTQLRKSRARPQDLDSY